MLEYGDLGGFVEIGTGEAWGIFEIEADYF